jgi:pyruvate carboxylase subunit B
VELIVTLSEGGETREERVSVRRDGDRFAVVLGERRYEVDARALAAGDGGGSGGVGLWSLIVEGAQHQVAVTPEGDDRYRVSTAAGLHTVGVTDPLTHLARQAHGAAAGGGGDTVTAYMPGRVAAVLAAVGDEVAAGQGVVVLEAMKMENEIAPEHPGRIAKIHVEEGQAVEGGDPLFDLEPLDG